MSIADRFVCTHTHTYWAGISRACSKCGATSKTPAITPNLKPHPLLVGMFYWPSPEYSTPADDLCWHVPPSPNADYRCVRPRGHPGKHGYSWSPTIKDHSHKGGT